MRGEPGGRCHEERGFQTDSSAPAETQTILSVIRRRRRKEAHARIQKPGWLHALACEPSLAICQYNKPGWLHARRANTARPAPRAKPNANQMAGLKTCRGNTAAQQKAVDKADATKSCQRDPESRAGSTLQREHSQPERSERANLGLVCKTGSPATRSQPPPWQSPGLKT